MATDTQDMAGTGHLTGRTEEFDLHFGLLPRRLG
jgi:hypothetical protein